MNDAWSNFSSKVANTADYLCRETEKLVYRAKLRYKIITAKKKLDEEYCRLGKIKYTEMNNITDGNDIPEDISGCAAECVEKIGTMIKEIKELEEAYKTAQNP